MPDAARYPSRREIAVALAALLADVERAAKAPRRLTPTEDALYRFSLSMSFSRTRGPR
jgi:hypothetical protein